MLYLATGTPGAKKTVFVVSKLDKVERDNKVNLVKNKDYYQSNQSFMDTWRSDFGYYEYEVGTGHLLRNEIEILSDDYFDMFNQEFDDLRPDDYFMRSTRFNEICKRIHEREGAKDFKYLLPVRTIYTNIRSLKIDYVRSMEYDWRTCPDGSIIVIDEVQNVEPYQNIKDKNDPIIKDLTVHRHRGFDFYFITQYPSLLHPTVAVIIGVHFHLTVPYGLKTKVYQFGSIRAYPNTMANKFNCENKFYFSPPDRLFKLYKSTTINTHQKRIPYKQLMGFGVLTLAASSIFAYGLMGAKDSELVGGKGFTPVTAAVESPALSHASVKAPDTPVVPKAPDTPVVPTSQPYAQSVRPDAQVTNLYNPVTGDYYASVDVAVAGAVMVRGKCQAFNKKAQNVPMPDSECSKYLDTFGNMAKS